MPGRSDIAFVEYETEIQVEPSPQHMFGLVWGCCMLVWSMSVSWLHILTVF